ncbi:phage tail assembly protein [Cupriavidus taiwanensis]|uniref:phage tail assembly protein n=1 Tax=Cupriavidus taiwanensis TaxID=164546 RepID=UPI0039C3112C
MAALVSIKVPLSEPLKLKGGGELTELVMGRPKARHLRTMEMTAKPSMGMILDLAAELAGLTPEEIDELEAADAMEVVSELGPFLVKDAGTKPSPSSPTPSTSPQNPYGT